MRWQRRFVLWLVPAVACGSVQALPPDGEPDVPPPEDGPTIQISGTVREVGTQDVAGGAAIGVVRIADRAVLGTTLRRAGWIDLAGTARGDQRCGGSRSGPHARPRRLALRRVCGTLPHRDLRARHTHIRSSIDGNQLR
jgi:hypothetical protein